MPITKNHPPFARPYTIPDTTVVWYGPLAKKLSTQKQRLSSGFHSARISEICSLWTDVYTSLGLDSRFAQDPLLGEAECLSYTKSSLTLISSKTRQTYFRNSEMLSIYASLHSCSSIPGLKPGFDLTKWV